MELKLANDEEKDKPSGGLRLSGAVEEQEPGLQKTEDDPWDFGKQEKPFTTRSISSTAVEYSDMYSHSGNAIHILVKLGRIAVYIAILLSDIAAIWVLMQPKVDMFYNAMKIGPLNSIIQLLLIVDAVLVNVLYKKKISLVFWAWLLGFVYPIKRDNHVNGGSAWGGIICFVTLSVGIAFGVGIYTSLMSYGEVVQNEDAAVRTEIAAFMEQPVADGGETYGEKLKRNFFIQDAIVETQGSKSVLMIGMKGQYGVTSDNFIDYTDKTVPTQLTFVRDSSGNYQLAGVILDNTRLADAYTNYYWNSLLR